MSMKKCVSLLLALFMVLTMVLPAFAAADSVYIYLRPENFSAGSWTPMENEAGAIDGLNLKGKIDQLPKTAVPASAQVEIPKDGEYYVWARGMDHETVPGTRNYQVALGEKVLPKKMATHGINGYKWELAGSVTLKAGKSFLKLLDTSCYYARCDCVVITDDKNYIPPESIDEIKAAIQKYQPKAGNTAVADTSVPTEAGNEATPPAGYNDTSVAETDGKTLIVPVGSKNFFVSDHWGGLSRGEMQGLYRTELPATAIWHPNIIKPVTVTISAYIPLDLTNKAQNDSRMNFEVHYGEDDCETVVFDAQKAEKEGWVTLGTYKFSGNGKEFVQFEKTTAKGSNNENISRIASMKFEATEGTIVCGDTVPAKPAGATYNKVDELTIAKGGSGYFEAGSWAADEKNGLDNKASAVTAAKNALAVFHPMIVDNKDIEVLVYNNPTAAYGKNADKEALYTVVHNGKQDKVTFDMTQKAGWYSIGTYTFKGDGNEYVKLEKQTADTGVIVRSCAVRFKAAEIFKVSKDVAKMPNGVSFKAEPLADKSVLFDDSAVSDYALSTAHYNPSDATIVSFSSDLYSETGKWYNSGLAGYYDSVLQRNTSSRYSFDPYATAKWGTGGLKGEAEVSIYKLTHANSDNKARVKVIHNGKTDVFYLDFTADNESRWITLGVFDFAGTADEGVTIDNEETALTCRANAVRFEQSFVHAKNEDENGKTITILDVSNDFFDRIPAQAEKQNVNYEKTKELSVEYNYAKDGVRSVWSGAKINLAKKEFDGNIAVKTNLGSFSVPLSEITIDDADSFVAEQIASNKKADGVAGKAYDFTFYILKNGEKVPFVTKEKPIEIKFSADTSDKEAATLVKLTDSGTAYLPSYIDNYGAFGEIHASYNSGTFQDRLNVFNGPVFAMGNINQSETLGIAVGNVKMADMSNHWAESDVNLMASKGLVYGKGNGYDPEAPVTRAEFCALLLRAAGIPQSEETSGFSDVPETEWYASTVSGAKKAGLLEGLPYTDTFEPEKAITREEMSAMIVNAAKYVNKFKNTLIEADYYLNDFTDKDTIASWAKEPVARATELGIIKGIEKDGAMTFAPQENSTRAQAAVMLKRFLDIDAYVGPLGNGEWELTFHDEFDGDDLNDEVWDSVNGPHSHIASSRYRENVEVHDGKAYLIAKDEDKGGKNWTSASIWTRNFDQTYGYFEAKYKYPDSESMHYNIAFWLYKSLIHVNNTKYYEIDINEGRMPGTVQTAEHYSDDNVANRGSVYNYQWMTDDYRKGYHIFALEWTEDEMIWYVDGREIRRRSTTYSDQPMQVYLSTAIMNDSTEEELLKDVDGSAMEVEYVRVYQRKK